MTYDPKRGRVVLFGGYAQGDSPEHWEFDGTSWSMITAPTMQGTRVGPGLQSLEIEHQRLGNIKRVSERPGGSR